MLQPTILVILSLKQRVLPSVLELVKENQSTLAIRNLDQASMNYLIKLSISLGSLWALKLKILASSKHPVLVTMNKK